jgi:hypothetical protein
MHLYAWWVINNAITHQDQRWASVHQEDGARAGVSGSAAAPRTAPHPCCATVASNTVLLYSAIK